MFNAINNFVNDVACAIDRSNRIWVILHQPSYVSGDIVSGTVEMDCLVPFVAQGVLLKMKGFERVFWQYTVQEFEGEGQNRRAVSRLKEHKETKEFFKTVTVVYPHQGTVQPGHYSFPFQFQLPAGLPGTFFEEGGHKGSDLYYAKVLYKVKATVDVAFRHDLKSTTKLVVNEKFDQLVAPSYGENSKTFLIGSGGLNVRTWLDKNAYFPGETLMCKLKANNTSTKPTNKIFIKVFHVMQLKAHNAHKDFRHCVYEQTFPGFEPCFYGVKFMLFNIPINLKPSSLLGHHVHSSYIFEIECDIPGAINLSVKLPVRMLAPQFLWSSTPPQPKYHQAPPTVSIRPPWQPDDDAKTCPGCKASFGVFKWKHHCRHCAKVFCADCVAKKVPIPKLKYKDPEHVCNTCFPLASNGGVKYQSCKAVYATWNASQPPMSPGPPHLSPHVPPQAMGSPQVMPQQPLSPQMPQQYPQQQQPQQYPQQQQPQQYPQQQQYPPQYSPQQQHPQQQYPQQPQQYPQQQYAPSAPM